MPDVEDYELLILGGGKAGKILAMDMARAGRRVAVVERGLIGVSCINIACIPTKTLVRSAAVASLLHHRAMYGIRSGETAVDMPAVAARTAGVVAGMVDDHRRLFAESGFELIIGEGRFVAPRVIGASLPGGGARRLTGQCIFLNLGTRAVVPDLPGLRAAAPLTHVEALRSERLPRHLLVLGGGYVGMEMAQAFRRLGSAVTIIERGPQLAGREDPDVAAAILGLFGEEGIAVHLGTTVTEVTGRSGGAVTLRCAHDGYERMLEGSDILVAAGRVPQTAGIGLELVL